MWPRSLSAAACDGHGLRTTISLRVLRFGDIPRGGVLALGGSFCALCGRSEAMKKSARNHRRTKRRLGLFEPLEQRLLLAGDITTGLVHYWTFDETSGDIAHDS